MIEISFLPLIFTWYLFPRLAQKRGNIQWAQTEKTNKTAIHEQKIKCAYLPAEDGSTGVNGIPEENEEPASGEPSRIEESVSVPVSVFATCLRALLSELLGAGKEEGKGFGKWFDSLV